MQGTAGAHALAGLQVSHERSGAVKGYIVIDAEIIDPEAYPEFAEKVPAAIAADGSLCAPATLRQSKVLGCRSGS